MNQPTINAFVPGTCGESIGLGKTCADLGIPIVLPTHFHVLDTFFFEPMCHASNLGKFRANPDFLWA